MKMRKTLATMMSGIIAMSPAGVIFADEAVETPVTYGDMISLSLTQGGETLSADITAVYNESGDSSFSVSVTLPASMMGTEEPVVYGFDDVLMKYRIRKNSISSNKLKVIKYHWVLYRNIEHLSFLRSIFHIFYWCCIKILKIK